MSSHWNCESCNFGPHSVELHKSCMRCGSPRTGNSSSEDMHSHHGLHMCNAMSPYPAPVHNHELSSSPLKGSSPVIKHGSSIPQPSLFGGDIHDRPTSNLASYSTEGARMHGSTFLYICCNCQDGPKTYNMQPRCVICNHVVCSNCQHVK
ncbi:hypothetical protein P170DRAFT_254420 [Aspergillus steynii IBT 23096]|uniref:RanBP2-type domain-containing protein n=1 Tax=Aspergillus steynii IBT 23096 TaxID=1392250 RepID=A0A2I2FZ30_9EURO|nr:uncharacterized protein P170DRAFT_254420 [Aspergillus steynii IBT 23096]PLB45884.1 hypothetical protein P170DRAFT_254420 [Aspergillus steynii IBT 23096]